MNEKLEYALSYFELHAKQRLSTFNFFVILSALLTTALIKTFEKDFACPELSYGVSLALMWVSIIFWKLDERVRFLIQHAEEELGNLETHIVASDPKFPKLFNSESEKTKEASGGIWNGILFHHLRYSQCFQAIYLLFFVIGVIGIIVKLLQ